MKSCGVDILGMTKLNFEITTPEGVVYKEEVDQVTLPTQKGEITVLPNHIPLVAILKPGELKIVKNKEEEFLACAGGYIEVLPGNRVVVLADNAERAKDIDITRAEAARKQAEDLLKQKHTDDVDYTALAGKIERELTRLRVARRHPAKHGNPQIEK